MKAIETKYNGYNFRSRLEARWAVFFDCLGIKYEYEMEGFTDGKICYLPDFYFPKYDFYAEIKPSNHNDADLIKWEMFSKEKVLVVLSGSPHMTTSVGYGLYEFELEVIPFVNLIKESYGTFWFAGGDEDFGKFEPFKTAIRKSRETRF